MMFPKSSLWLLLTFGLVKSEKSIDSSFFLQSGGLFTPLVIELSCDYSYGVAELLPMKRFQGCAVAVD